MRNFNTALITGAASGLGQALAERLSRKVPNLVLWDRNADGLQATAGLCSATRCTTQRVDLADLSSVTTAFLELKARAEIPDFIFHAAGILDTGGLDAVTPESCRRMIEVNYLGTVNLLLTVTPHMRNRSRILCVSSIAGLKGLPEFAAYCASKFAVVGFCEAIHHELKSRGIHLSVICPPAVDTPMVQGLKDRPALYELFPFAEKNVVIDRIEEAMEMDGEFLVLIDLQSRLLRRVNGMFPGLTSTVLATMVDRWHRKHPRTP